ncbi:MAG TPA: hypothetical protein PLQ97_08335 [Myxococcota bacterium]|nr:hypothetical protein [Myxococcota bacterium]HQK50827.1 hypothetical protein [Myxococcota bacterium]
MASPTNKVDKIRKNKRAALGQRRKREIRRDIRQRTAEVGRMLGLLGPGALEVPSADRKD